MDIVLYQEMLYSFGERQHAISFARRIAAAGYRPRFVVAREIAEGNPLPGFEPLGFSTPAEGIDLVRKIDPALVIGCELWNLSEPSLEGLDATGLPLATLDGTSLGLEIRTDPFHDPAFRQSIRMPDGFHALRACPVNDVARDEDRIHHWWLFSEERRAAKDPDHYAALGLDPRRKTVLLPVAPWAQHFCGLEEASLAGFAGYHRKLTARIADGLSAAGEAVDLVIVARGPRQATRRGELAIHAVGLLAPGPYDHLLRSCDAIVADNVIQASIAKAFCMGTPHLVIQNLLPSELPYPCNIAPLRRRFPAEREWAQAVEVAEFADPAGIRERLAAILRDGHFDAQRRERRSRYRERLSGLATPAAILERIVGPAR